jgi:HPt (histidine-containing phosphotransfer) domain-containing protein
MEKHLDWDTGVGQIGDEASYKNFVDFFMKDSIADCIKNLKANLKTQNWTEVRRAAHSLKGSSSYISAPQIHKKAEILQKAAEANPMNNEFLLTSYFDLFDYLVEFNEVVSKKFAKSYPKTDEALKVRELGLDWAESGGTDDALGAVEEVAQPTPTVRTPEATTPPPPPQQEEKQTFKPQTHISSNLEVIKEEEPKYQDSESVASIQDKPQSILSMGQETKEPEHE